MIIYDDTQMENKIRAAIGIADSDYQQSVAAIMDSLPKPREKDAAFKKRISPFQFLDLGDEYSVYLDAGSYMADWFQAQGLLGNGYDWTTLAQTFIRTDMPELEPLLTFSPEAGTFSVSSPNKKALRTFAETFKAKTEEMNTP